MSKKELVTRALHEALKNRVQLGRATGGIPGPVEDGLLHLGMLGAGTLTRLRARVAHGPDQDAQIVLDVAGVVAGTLTIPAGSTALHTVALATPAADGDALRVAISGASGASDLVWMVE